MNAFQSRILITSVLLTSAYALPALGQIKDASSFQRRFSSEEANLQRQIDHMQHLFRNGASHLRDQAVSAMRDSKSKGASDEQVIESYLNGQNWEASVKAWQKIYSDKLNMELVIGDGDETLQDEAFLASEYAAFLLAGLVESQNSGIASIQDRNLSKMTRKTKVHLVQDLESLQKNPLVRDVHAATFANPVLYNSKDPRSTSHINELFKQAGFSFEVEDNGRLEFDYDFSQNNQNPVFTVELENGSRYQFSTGTLPMELQVTGAKIKSVSVKTDSIDHFQLTNLEEIDIQKLLNGRLKAKGQLVDGAVFRSTSHPYVLENSRQIRIKDRNGVETIVNSAEELTEEQIQSASEIHISHRAMNDLVGRLSGGKAKTMSDEQAEKAIRQFTDALGLKLSDAKGSIDAQNIQSILNPFQPQGCHI